MATRDLNALSVLTLVASDASYKSKSDFRSSDVLSNFPDNASKDEYPFAKSLLANLPQQPFYASREGTPKNGVSVVEFPNWLFVNKIEDPGTGFGAVLYRSAIKDYQGKYEFILALEGTNEIDTKDWYANVDYARTVWGLRSAEVLALLNNEIRIDGESPVVPASQVVHITGQSLGGGLAQYAAYDLIRAKTFETLGGRANPNFDRNFVKSDQVTLTTFNAFGGVRGLIQLSREREEAFLADLLTNVPTRHYAISNDIVHRLGKGSAAEAQLAGGSWHLNGVGNSYTLDFRRFENGRPAQGDQSYLGIVEAHRIESGFYAGFDNYQTDFATALSGPLGRRAAFQYIDTDCSQNVAGSVSRAFTDQKAVSPLGAKAGLAVGAVLGVGLCPLSETRDLVKAFGEAAYKSSKTVAKADQKLFNRASPGILAKAILSKIISPLPVISLGIDFLSTILKATPEEKQQVFDVINQGLPADRKLQKPDMPAVTSQAEAFERYELAAAAVVADEDRAALSAEFKDLADVVQVAQAFPEAWEAVLRASGSAFFHEAASTLQTAAAAHMNPLDLMNFDIKLVKAFDGEIRAIAGLDSTVANNLAANLKDFVQTDFAAAYANAHQDFTAKIQLANASVLGAAQFDSVDYQPLENALIAASKDPQFAEIKPLIDQALDIVGPAGERLYVAPGHPASNPFDTAGFDPDSAPVPSEDLAEGSAQTFTAFLPYEAGTGGQHIRMNVQGELAGKVTVVSDSGEIDLPSDGTFDLVVAEGERQASFGFWANEDINSDATLTLSATLTDAGGQATHLEHEEATIQLDGREESAGSGGLELRGDWGPKPFPYVGPDGNTYYRYEYDDRFEPGYDWVRDPAIPVGTYQPGPLVGSRIDDHIVAGEFGGESQAFGLSGNDYIEGKVNVPNRLYGDHAANFMGFAGNDVIEGGENSAPYSTAEYVVGDVTIKGTGDDLIYGGLGDDDLYGDRIASLDQLLDPDTPASNQKGDWINGEQGDDRIYGSAAKDALFGGGGSDVIRGGAGDDVLDGDDSYYIHPDAAAYWQVDSGPSDVVFTPVNNVQHPVIAGGYIYEYYKDWGGDDVLDGGSGDDLILGMIGNDTLIGGSGDDKLEGWEGDDELYGGDGDDVIAGDFGRYELPNMRAPGWNLSVMPGTVGPYVGDASTVDQIGDDYLDGGKGDDILFGEGGNDYMLGGDGNDQVYGDAIYLPDELHGSDFVDGGMGNDGVYGNGGNDTLYGGGGSDGVFGGAGDDFVDGGADDDSLFGDQGNDVLFGRDGFDTLDGGEGDDDLDGGPGDDVLSGQDGNDILRGGDGSDVLDGGVGNDSLFGGIGDDVLSGGEGDDFLDGGDGADILRGGAGDDVYYLDAGYGHETIEDAEGDNRVRFGSGVLREELEAELNGSELTVSYGFAEGDFSIDLAEMQLAGVDFADGPALSTADLLALAPAVVANGSGNDDVLDGSPYARNELSGFSGDDVLTGGASHDVLAGGPGNDEMDGGDGNDTYVIDMHDGVDTIYDSDGNDTITFGESITPDMLTLGVGSLLIRVGNEGDAVHIDGFDPADVYGSSVIENFVFSDGTALRYDELLARGFDVLGGEGDDNLGGTNVGDRLLGYDGNDVLRGGAGDDVLIGGEGGDEYVFDVGYGHDVIQESDAEFDDLDTITFGPGISRESVSPTREGSDLVLNVLDGDDRLTVKDWFAGAEHQVEGASFFDGTAWDSVSLETGFVPGRYIVGTEDADTLSGLEGDDTLMGAFGDDTLSGGIGADMLYGGPGADILDGGAGSDNLFGEEGSDTLLGGPGTDYLSGGPESDVLSGGPGADTLFGDSGNDVYVYGPGDGRDLIYDGDASPESNDTLRFADSITPADVQVTRDEFSLYLVVGNGADRIALNGMVIDPAARIENVQFADGTVWSPDDLYSRVALVPATSQSDTLWGTARADTIYGLAGDDTFFGNGGDDFLSGGRGNDTYIFARGDGNDTIDNADTIPGKSDALTFAADVLPEDIALSHRGDDLVFTVSNGGGSVSLKDWYSPYHTLEYVLFRSNWSVWPSDAIAARAAKSPPVVWHETGDQNANEDEPFVLTLAADVFASPDSGDELALRATTEDDGLLPSWLAFDAETRTFSGTPVQDDVGSITVKVTASDPDGLSAYDTFTLSVANTNDAPTIDVPISAQAATEDEPFAFTVPDNAFRDVDSGDTLTLSVDSADGSPLPAWLAFDAATQTLSGTPGNEDVGAYALRVMATDAAGAAVSEEVALTVANVNDPPQLAAPIPDRLANQNAPFTFTIPDGTFTDVDRGDRLALSATLAGGSALPGWLTFDALTVTVTGTPHEQDAGLYSIAVTATDQAGAAATGTFAVSVSDAGAFNTAREGTPLADVIVSGFDNDFITSGAGNDKVTSGAGRDVVFSGQGDDNLSLGYGNDIAFGGAGRDRIDGGPGNDLVLGGDGADMLGGDPGNDALCGGPGGDVLYAGAGNKLMMGGQGGDILSGGSGHDVFALNRFDGRAWLFLLNDALPGNCDTLSFGAGIAAGDIVLRRDNNDLIVKIEASDTETVDGLAKAVLKDWYGTRGRRTISRLQLIGDRVETYDFKALVARFDAERTANHYWRAGAAMPRVLINTSTTDAIGGALAYQYARAGTLANVAASTLEDTLRDPHFADAPQSIRNADGATLSPYFATADAIDADAALNALFGAMSAQPVAPVSASGLTAAPRVSMNGQTRPPPPNAATGKIIPLDLQAIVDAIKVFDANSAHAGYNVSRQSSPVTSRKLAPHVPIASLGLTSWAVTNALLQFHLTRGDGAMSGGSFAEYTKNGGFSPIGLSAVPPSLGAPGFGRDAQSLRPFTGLRDGLAVIGSPML